MATIKLDVVYGSPNTAETLADALHELVHGLNVTFDETGVYVAGGWPEVEFSGSVGDLEVLCHRYVGPNDFDLFRELIHTIKE